MKWTINQLKLIRELLCNLEIKGYDNAVYLAAAIKTCDDTMKSLMEASNLQNGENSLEKGDTDATGHTG